MNIKKVYSAWNPQSEHHGRRVRFLEDCENNASLRFVGFADELDRGYRNDNPRGWYCDNFQGDVYRAAVWQLPGRKGEAYYLAGYVEPWNDGAMIDVGSWYAARGDDFESARTAAARDAQSMAERFAEAQRDAETEYSAEERREECLDEIRDARDEHSQLIAEIRALAVTDSGASPMLCAAIRATLASLRETVRELRRERDQLEAEPWTINPSY